MNIPDPLPPSFGSWQRRGDPRWMPAPTAGKPNQRVRVLDLECVCGTRAVRKLSDLLQGHTRQCKDCALAARKREKWAGGFVLRTGSR